MHPAVEPLNGMQTAVQSYESQASPICFVLKGCIYIRKEIMVLRTEASPLFQFLSSHWKIGRLRSESGSRMKGLERKEAKQKQRGELPVWT